MNLVEDTTTAWLKLSELFERTGQTGPAKLVRFLVDDLERRHAALTEELLTIDQAAAESGYAYSSLQHLIADGVLPNAGRRGRPRVRRNDLERHRQEPPDAEPKNASSRAGDASVDLVDEILMGFEK